MSKTAEELREEAARQREQLSYTVDAIGDRVSPGRIVERRTNRIKDGIGRARSAVMGTADHAMHAVTDVAGGAASAAGGAASTAGSFPSHAASSATERAAGNPLAAGAVAFGVGFLAAAVFPGTRAEQRAAMQLKEAAQPLMAEAKQIGQEAAEHLREPAQEALASVKEVATDRAAEVQDSAKGTVRETTQAASGAVEDVKAKAPGSSS